METKHLVFTTDNRTFALNFSDIKVIVPATEPKKIPDFPDYVSGTITNDGVVVPVINLRKRFGYEDKQISDRDCIIITEGEKSVGLLCDSISGFKELSSDKILPPPNINEEASAKFLCGEFLLDDNLPCYILSPLLILKSGDERKIGL